MRYVLLKTQVGDLYCQKTMLEEFSLEYIKNNTDGNILAKVYLDFISAVDYIQSLDKQSIRDKDGAREYFQEFALNQLQNRLYQYPDED